MVIAIAALTLVTVLLAGALRWQQRAHAREARCWTDERRELVAAVCHAHGRPLPSSSPPPPPREREPSPLVADVDQLPV